MKVILLEDIKTLGKTGDQVTVKDGYGRNYLLPRQLALPATPASLKVFANEKKAREKKQSRVKAEAQALADKLAALSLTITRLAGEEDKLFGSVTNGDIAEAVKAEGFTIDKRKIELPEPIKALGNFEVPLQLHHDVTVMLKVWVVKQESEPAPEADAPVEEPKA
jgi:large subunit ribosomal protein L9